MKEKTTRVCGCGAPLHWTFLYNGAEYLCMNCGANFGMLGADQEVPITNETKANQKVAQEVFKALRKHLWGSGGFTRSNCKKCKERKGEYHPQHATKYEEARVEVAGKMLKRLKGYLNKL